MTEKKKESPAMTHMREVSGRANEHLEKKLLAKIKIAKLNLQCDKIGAFQNPYLSLESIIKNCETVLQDIGIDVTFNDMTHVMSRIGNDPSDIDPSIAIIRMNAIYIPTGAEFEPLTLTVSLDEKKRTAQGKKSAMTYAKRVLYSNFLSLPESDDDGTGSMSNRERLEAIQVLCGWNMNEKTWEIPALESVGEIARKTFFMLQAEAKKKAQDKSSEDISAKKGKTAFTGTDIFQEDAK
jgi:hypothetical protein